jgi:calnexin
LWTISDGIAFDNILITDDIDVAKHISSLTYQIKKEISDSETDNIIVKAMKYTNKYPWLWAVYVLAVGLPVVLFIAFCCVSPVKRDTTQSQTGIQESTSDQNIAQKKKTDQLTPDDNLIEEDEEKVLNIYITAQYLYLF